MKPFDGAWEDYSEPLRKIPHPSTRNLLTLSIILLISSIGAFLLPWNIYTGISVGIGITWLSILIYHTNNVKYNPVSSGSLKTWVNTTTTFALIIASWFVFACLMNYIAHLN